MRIPVRVVQTIDVLYIPEDNYYEFAWIKGNDDWHLSVF